MDKWCPVKKNHKIFSSILSQDVIRPFEVVSCSFELVLHPDGAGTQKTFTLTSK